jgi:arylsulfatase A-like enzyme
MTYHAMVKALDDQVGNLTAAVQAKGMWGNTLLWSDEVPVVQSQSTWSDQSKSQVRERQRRSNLWRSEQCVVPSAIEVVTPCWVRAAWAHHLTAGPWQRQISR